MPAVNKIIIKVGKTSRVKFHGVKAYRAITMDELERLSELNPDASIVVVENIKSSDDNRLRDFIEKFENISTNNKVFFYVPDNDDATCGVADELAADIYLNIKDLYKSIKNRCGIEVDIDLEVSKKLSGDLDGYDAFDESFSDAIAAISDNNTTSRSELPNIDSKEDIIDFDRSIMHRSDLRLEKAEEVETRVVDSTDEGLSVESIDDGVIKRYESEIEQLRKQLKTSFDKADELTMLAKALEDERDAFKAKAMLFSDSDVMEDPITLAEYEGLKAEIERLKECGDQISSNESTLIDRIAELETDKDELKKQLDDYKDRLRESGSKLSNAQSELSELRHKAELVSEDTNKMASDIEDYKKKIERLTEQVTNYRSRIDELTTQLSIEVNSRLFAISNLDKAVSEMQSAEERYNDSLKTIDNLEESIKTYQGRIQDLSSRVTELSQSDTVIFNLTTERDNLEKIIVANREEIESLRAKSLEDASTIASLRTQVADVDKRVELARKFATQDLDSIRQEASDWKSKYEIISEEFTRKDAQYNKITQLVGMDGDGLQTLLDSSRSVEEVNKTLRGQLVSLKSDLDKARKEATFAKQTASALEETNRSLKTSIEAMATSAQTGGHSNVSMRQIKYTGKAMVIPVFGSGSYGITTTAMSLANKLSAQARTIYIDFDMVAPKADSWFRVNPILKSMPDVEPNSQKASGLGLFVDKGLQYFLRYASSLILKPLKTKSGCIDYISGFYAKPAVDKLLYSDFSSLLNYLSNSYAYIIIDFGRLGNSETNDAVIKEFSNIAFKNVVVTTGDKFELRTFRIKISEAKININNIAWLINVCEKTALDDVSKRFISPAPYFMIPFNPELYGKRIDFTKERITRDKFGLFMETVLFRK